MGIFEKGRQMSARAFDYASEPISYFRNDTPLAENIRAKVSEYLFRAENNFGVTVRTIQIDFTVQQSDLTTEPAVGDIIHYDGCKYLVCAPNDEPCWRWHIPHRQKRIHAKFIGSIEP